MSRDHVLPSEWALWSTPPADGITNMAIDIALQASVRTGRAVWRWYAWSEPTVSFGRNEAVAGRYSPASVAAAGLAAVRRPTGGRALLHEREITYSVTMPLPASRSWREGYHAVNTLLAELLQRAGIAATLAPAGPSVTPNGPVCFDVPAEGELIVAGRKLVGSAVWRQGDAYLQHGSILIEDRQYRLAEGACTPVPPAPPAAALADLTPSRSDAEQLAACDHALRSVLGERARGIEPFAPPATWETTVETARTQQASDAWIWRR